MSDVETLAKAFEAAKAAGDTENATKFAEALVAASKQPEREGNWYDAPRSMLQGLTFGGSDEAGAMMAAVPAAIATGTNPIAAYKDMRGAVDAEQKAYAAENPWKDFGLQMAGGLLPAVTTGVRAAPMLPQNKALAGSVIGGGQSGLYGLLSGDPGERGETALKYGATGALLTPPLSWVLGKAAGGIGSVAGWAANKLASTPNSQANSAIRGAVEGISPDTIVNRYKAGGTQFTLADTDDSLRYLLRAASDKTSALKNNVRGLLDSRQEGATGRMAQAAEQSLGANADDFAGRIAQMRTDRGATAGPLYEQAWNQGITPSQELTELMGRPAMKKAMASAVTLAKDAGDDPKQNMLKTLHYAKMALDRRISQLMRSEGSTTAVRNLLGIKTKLLAEMDAASPAYASARDQFADESSLITAGERGLDFFKMSVDDMNGLVAGMGSSEKELLRHGVVKAISDKLDKTELTADATRKLINTKELRKKLSAVFPSMADAETFIKQAMIEREQALTRRVATQGSMTSSNIQAGNQLESGIQPETLAAFTSGDVLGMLAGTAKEIFGKKNVSPEVLQALGNKLLRSGMSEAEVRRILTQPPLARYSGLLGQNAPAAITGVAGGLLGPASNRAYQ